MKFLLMSMMSLSMGVVTAKGVEQIALSKKLLHNPVVLRYPPPHPQPRISPETKI